ncbi:hypothetical protein [Brevibacillus sp. SYSU BS000544]|uniref:hypothetical protein n=1 Tax=Brevibacillus sp. SYSU BS000544 TaxID=3416443 RepID=UPI003CE44C60
MKTLAKILVKIMTGIGVFLYSFLEAFMYYVMLSPNDNGEPTTIDDFNDLFVFTLTKLIFFGLYYFWLWSKISKSLHYDKVLLSFIMINAGMFGLFLLPVADHLVVLPPFLVNIGIVLFGIVVLFKSRRNPNPLLTLR